MMLDTTDEAASSAVTTAKKVARVLRDLET